MKNKDVVIGERFVIPDGPRVKGFDELVKMMMAGAMLPETIKIDPPKSIPFSARELAQVITDLTVGEDFWDIHDDTGLSIERCKEIIEIRNKLVDNGK